MNKKDQDKLNKILSTLKKDKETFIGYPVNTLFDYSDLYDFLSIPLNNVGDPFCSSYYGLDSRNIEREVLDWFAISVIIKLVLFGNGLFGNE